MRILFLTQVLPYPLDAGPKIRAYYTLRYLSQRHEITLLSFVRPDDPLEAIEHLRTFCQAVHTVPMPRSRARDTWHLLHSLTSGTPFLITRDWVPEMADRVSQIAYRTSRIAYRRSQVEIADRKSPISSPMRRKDLPRQSSVCCAIRPIAGSWPSTGANGLSSITTGAPCTPSSTRCTRASVIGGPAVDPPIQ